MEIKIEQFQPFSTTFELNEVEVIKFKENEIPRLKAFSSENLIEDCTYDHLHYEWIKVYENFHIFEFNEFSKSINEDLIKYCSYINKDLETTIQEIASVYDIYIRQMQEYLNPKEPSIDSYKNLLKYSSFLSSHKSKFYIDAETGYFGCTIKKKIGRRKKKSIDLLFKSNYEVIFCLTKDMINLIHIRGVADFDDDLEDIKAVSWLLDY